MNSFVEIFRSHCVFDTNGRHTNGTDRQSNHNYGDAYDYLFPDRESIKEVLEVGNADGSGMLSFREAFPNATIVGLDIHPCAAAGLERIECHVGDQRIKADCERAARGHEFDAIIEDGYHDTTHTLLTLFWLWPFVRRGGIYIIEEFADVHSHVQNIESMFRGIVQICPTQGPFGGNEPLVVLRKP